jgi:uncharacterized Zn-finger protein
MFQTVVEFTLPGGYVDAAGTLHRTGSMRRATAGDEVAALSHPRVRAHEAYMPILLLSRVITRLGPLGAVTPEMVEGLFAVDFVYLQDLYLQLNGGSSVFETQCPTCGTRFLLDTSDAQPTS